MTTEQTGVTAEWLARFALESVTLGLWEFASPDRKRRLVETAENSPTFKVALAAMAVAEAHAAKMGHFATCRVCLNDEPDCLEGERVWRAEMDAGIAYRATKEAPDAR